MNKVSYIGVTSNIGPHYRGLDGHMRIEDYTEFHLIQWMRNGDKDHRKYGTMCYIHVNKVGYVALASALTTRNILDQLMHTARAGKEKS